MATTVSSSCIPGAVCVLCTQGEETQIFDEILGEKEEPITQFRRRLMKWQACQLVEQILTPSGNAAHPNTTSKIELEKATDAIVGLTVQAEVPMICDSTNVATAAGTQGTVISQATGAAAAAGTLYHSYAPLTGTSSILRMRISSLTNGVANGSTPALVSGHFTPQFFHADTFVANCTCTTGNTYVLTGTGGGYCLVVAASTVGAATTARNYTVVAGSVVGDFAGSLYVTNIAGVPILVTDSTSYLLGSYTSWSVDAPGALLAGTITRAFDANGQVFSSVLVAISITAVAGGVAPTTADGLTVGVTSYGKSYNTDDAYYVNGMAAAAIKRCWLTIGGATLLNGQSGEDLRAREEFTATREKINQGQEANFGTLAQLKSWAHGLPYRALSTATVDKQVFVYDLPICQTEAFQHAIMLNAMQSCTGELKIEWEALSNLCCTSTSNATSTTLPNTRYGNHVNSGTAIVDADVTFSIVATYAVMRKVERTVFGSSSAFLISDRISTPDITAYVPSNAATTGAFPDNSTTPLPTIKLQVTHPGRWVIAGYKVDDTTAVEAGSDTIHSGYKNKFCYLRRETNGDVSTELISCLRMFDIELNGNQRASGFDQHQCIKMARKHCPRGAEALATGLMFFSYAPQTPFKVDEFTALCQQSLMDKYYFKVVLQPSTRTGSVKIWVEQNIYIFYGAGCVVQAFA